MRTGLEQDVIDYARSVDEIYEKTLEMLVELLDLGRALAELMQQRRYSEPLELSAFGVDESSLRRHATKRGENSLSFDMG